MPIIIHRKAICTDCGEPVHTENAHGVRYVCGYGMIIKSGETLCDKCLFRREVLAGLKSELTDVKKVS